MPLTARPLSLLVLVTSFLTSPDPASAQEGRRVHCDVEDADLGEVLVQVARTASASLVVDPRVQERVSVSLRDIPWRECVDVLARMTRCEVVERPSGVLFVTQPARLSATFEQAHVSSVLRLLAAQGGEPVWIDPAVSATVSVTVTEATWPEAVTLVAQTAGLQVAWVDGCALVSAGAPDAGLARRAPLAERFPDSRRVSLDPEDSTLASFLRDVVAGADVNLMYDPDALDDVPIHAVLRDVPWAEAVDLMLELTDCSAREAGRVVHVTSQARVTLELEAPSSVRASLRLLAAYGGSNLVLSPGVLGRGGVSLRGVPADLAMALVARSAGLHLWTDGLVVVVSHVPLVDPPTAYADDPPGPLVSMQAESAPPRGWFELVALAGGIRVELAPEVGPPVTAELFGVAPRRVVELTAWANGHEVEERDGVLHVAGEGYLAVEEEPAPAAPPAPASAVDPAELEARRLELEGRVDDLLKRVVSLAEQRQVEELIVTFTELRQLMSEGPLATEVVRAMLKKWHMRLRDLGEVQLSISLQLHVSEGNQLLRGMADAIRDERHADAAALFERLQDKAEEMRAEEREVFHRNAEALYLRGRALADRAERLALVAQHELRVTAVVPDVGAVINGALRRAGDTVLAADGTELPALRVVEIVRSTVRLRLGDTEFVRELGEP